MLFCLKWFLQPKHLIGIACGVFCLFWLVNGSEIISRTPGQSESKAIADFKRSNPKAADWLAQQQDRFGQFNTSVAIESLQGRVLNPEALKQSFETLARLTSLCQKDRAGDESVLWSHGTAIDAMSDLPNESNEYLTRLEEASADQDYWSLVRNDPVALSSKLLKSNLELRKHYQDNQAWYVEMTEVLVAMIGITSADDTVDTDEEDVGFIQLDDLLEVANEGKPYLMQLVPNPSESALEACIYYETFRQFGQVISMAAKQGVPPKEATEVIVLNRDALLKDDEMDGAKVKEPTTVAARLVTLHRNRPSVWAAAQRDVYVLSFDELTPGLSQPVLEKHAELGAASLIVTQYRDVATQAAAIVDHYGELGVAVLVQYDGSENFRKLLRNANVDHRIAMVAVLKSDVGLESVLSDPAYIDKWIDQDGKPLADEWWVNVPLVGGVAKVAKNVGTGVPSDWSEIGWAAWDVGDVALMALSFGTSKVLTEAAKQTSKQTSKGIGKGAAKKLSEIGIKRIPGTLKPSAMTRLVSAAKASKSAAPIRWTSRAVIHVTRATKTMGGKLITASNRVIQMAKSIPPGVRKWAARGMLGASLFVRGPERVRALIDSLNKNAADFVSDAINAIERVKQTAREAAGGSVSLLVNILVIGISGLFAFAFLFDVGPRWSLAGPGVSVASGKRKK
jgi:hypothetical protein